MSFDEMLITSSSSC